MFRWLRRTRSHRTATAAIRDGRAACAAQRPRIRRTRLRLEVLERRCLLAANPVISELMASNQNGLTDEDGEFSDWVEIHNPTTAAVDLDGWRLTDTPDDLNQWTFPNVTLDAGAYLVVFASGKDRTAAGSELHTNFKLDSDGEYLALVAPDGTVAHSFTPRFPRQKDDVSYGLGQDVVTLVSAGAEAAVLVPGNGDLGTGWTEQGFGDSSWRHGPTGVGFETGAGQAQAVAYGNNAGNVGTQEFGGPLGMDFYVHQPITVTQLGVFDSGSNGLSRTLTAEIWTRSGNSGTLVTRLTFTPADPGALVAGDRFKPLATPLLLGKGDYTIVGYGYGAGEPNGNAGTGGPQAAQKTTNDGNGSIEFVGGGRYSATPGTFPANGDGGPANRYSAGTFQFLVPAYTGLIQTNVQPEMHGVNASAYLRVPFTCGDPAAYSSLSLGMKYDDGFVAWLNGTEVARRNAPDPLAWNSAATAAHPAEQAAVFENINLTPFLGLLHSGNNVLAIQGLNAAASDPDFLVLPQLVAAGVPGTVARYFDTPTPGGPNNSASSFAGYVEDTQLSVAHGFFQAPFDLTIATATAGAQIYYTLNGTEPSPTNGTLYQTPIRVATTTTLRAAGFKTGFLPTRTDTQTYLFLGAVVAQSNAPPGYPTVWNGGYTADYGMSTNAADLPSIAGNAGYTVAQAQQAIQGSLLALPTMSLVLPPTSMFDPATGIYVNPTGRDSDNWEKAVSIEYLLPDGSPGFQVNGGVQIVGYTSRNLGLSPKLSMRLLFKREYGAARLDYPLFPDSPAESYNTFILRANSRDSWLSSDEGSCLRSHALMLRNQWAAQAQKEMGEPATAGRFVHLYINGMYWGVYNPIERPDAEGVADYLGGSPADYDVVNFCFPRVIDGDITKWNQLLDLAAAGLGSDAAYQFIQGNNPDGSRNPNYEVLIDVDNLIDYVINGQYHANADWPGNYYVARKRGPDSTGFKFFTWDNDLGFPYEDISRNKTVSDGGVWWDRTPGRIDIALRANPEYRLRFADRVQRHFFNNGSLTPQAAADRFTRIANQLQPALAAESTRWGDYRRDVSPQGGERMLYTPLQWQTVSNTMLNSYFPNRTNAVLGQLRAVGLFPGINAPSLGQQGGSVPAGYALTMSAGAGTIYYTLDGSDPRLPGGAIHGTRYTAPVVLQESTRVKARVWDGSQWSALSEANFQVAGTPQAGIVVTELNYHPTAPTLAEQAGGFTDADAFEFVELANLSPTRTLDLHGARFIAGITFDFNTATVTSLAPGDRVLLVRNQAAFEARYGANLPVAGTYDGSLDDGGEQIKLIDGNNVTLADFVYDDKDAWPGRADGDGSSLELADTAGDYGNADTWQASAEYNGSPGRAGTGPMADVIINEVLSHSDAPLVDAIELYNTTDGPINIGGWFLSDSNSDYLKFRIPDNTVIAGHGYRVFYEGHWLDGALAFAADEFGGGPKGFGLDGVNGDDVYLVVADGAGRPARFADHVDFGGTVSGQSLGRWRDDQGRWRLYPMGRSTFDRHDNANATSGNGPAVGPLVVSEVMYFPKPLVASERTAGFSTPEDLEFIEIYNGTSALVPLTDWRLDNAVTYNFAGCGPLAPRGRLVVVPFDPARAAMLAAFRARYLIGTQVTVVGPYSGHLGNSGDRLQLKRLAEPPLAPALEDEVVYSSAWGGGSGDGKSLHRVAVDAWGDDKASWGAATSSPGTVRLVAGRRAFYNNSAFDGNDPAANSLDDAAIAVDKKPLLPGRWASFENYTSFSRGLNGIMVDLTGPSGTVVAADFAFRVGNGAPSGWSTLATLLAVTTRTVSGLTRVTLIWPDNTIRNRWLEVTVRSGAGTHTGLPAPNVFYFGNAVGETGDHATGAGADAVVDALDEQAVRGHLGTPALVQSPYDFNRDGLVDPADEAITAAGHSGSSPLVLSGVPDVLRVLAADWTSAGLTLTKSAGDGRLHVYATGTTSNAVPSRSPAVVSAVQLDGRDNADDALAIDFSGGNPVPSGGVQYDGGAGDGDSLLIADAAGSDTVTMTATQLTVNGSSVIRYHGVENFAFDLGAGTLDLGGSTQTVGGVTLWSGSVLQGVFESTSCTVYGGTVEARLTGVGGLWKRGNGVATFSAANSYSGGTKVIAGTLIVADANALPPGAAVDIGAGATVVLTSGLIGAADAAAAGAMTLTAAASVEHNVTQFSQIASHAPLGGPEHRERVGIVLDRFSFGPRYSGDQPIPVASGIRPAVAPAHLVWKPRHTPSQDSLWRELSWLWETDGIPLARRSRGRWGILPPHERLAE
jgi:autotransporter-associated beta strand protein